MPEMPEMPEVPEYILSLVVWDKKEEVAGYYQSMQYYKEKAQAARTFSEFANAVGIQNMYTHKIAELINYSRGFGDGLEAERRSRESEGEPGEA